MISEVANALFITFFASEYIIADNTNRNASQQQRQHDSTNDCAALLPPSVQSNLYRIFLPLAILSLINILDRITGAIEIANSLLSSFLHLPKILFAATSYLLALYLDVKRRIPISFRSFGRRVGWVFLRVLPAYPVLAVLISFVFMFVIRLWEVLALPEEWLNGPIYYGVLYGPFGWVYVEVKRQVFEEVFSLPS